MTSRAGRRLLLHAAAIAGLAGGAWTASAQAYVPASAAPQPLILIGAYLNLSYPDLLLSPPRAYGLLQAAPASSPEARMIAYRTFESALQKRTTGVVAASSWSSAQRREAKRKILADVGEAIESLPGGAVVTCGRRVWEHLQDSTDFEIEGYRLRFQMDDAVQGKLAIKMQKRLR